MPSTIRDFDVLREIARILDASGQFGRAQVANAAAFNFQSAQETSLVLAQLVGFEEADDMSGDDPDGRVQRIRDAQYALTIAVKDPDPEAAQDRLDRLGSVAANLLGGVSFLGATYPLWSQVRAGRYSLLPTPYAVLVLQGGFRYSVGDFPDHDEVDDLD